jgi:hypothetical protein
MLRKKIFKFWKWRIELKLNRIANKDKVEFLANQLIKELGIKCDPECECIRVWIHRKKDMCVENTTDGIEDRIECKYTGK